MQVLEKIKIVPKLKEKDVKFQVLILDAPLDKRLKEPTLLGRSTVDWIAFACKGLNIKVLKYESSSSLLEFITDKIDENFDYTMVLMSTIPLIKQSTIRELQDYAVFKNIGLCKLPVGYIVKNESLQKNTALNIDSVYSQNMDDFYVVENKKQFVYAEEVLQDRINSFHIENGVEIRKPRSVYIEPSVDIESGAVICAGNTLKGNTKIERDVILKENNVIENSRIGSGSCVSGCCINGSVLGSGVFVSAFCEIKNSQIGNDVMIGGGCKIYHMTIGKDRKIASNTVLGESNDSNSGAR